MPSITWLLHHGKSQTSTAINVLTIEASEFFSLILRPGKPIRCGIVWKNLVEILGQVTELRMAETPRDCPGLVGSYAIAAWRMVLDFAQGKCVTVVEFPQLETSFYEVDDGRSSFDDEEAASEQKPKESWADMMRQGLEPEIANKEYEVSELKKLEE